MSGHALTITSKLMSVVGYLVLGLVLLNGLMFLAQPSMVFMPHSRIHATPGDWRMSYEDVWFTATDGVELHGWYIPAPVPRGTLLFLHGNAGNISHRRDSIAIFRRLGLNVFILDYRGYGQSRGAPSERGLYADALGAWIYLTEERGIPADDIVIFGRSLGAIVATHLASQVDSRALIVESGFTSAADMARHSFPVLSSLVFLRFDFDAVGRIAHVDAPVLVLHSPDDEIIPYELGRKLYAAAREPKEFVALRGDHNSGFLRSQPAYEQSLAAFLANHRGSGGTP
ncbi:alpha/beta hydrolase [Thioalkalicoccus limnaeus]|uniref:Alpha/beta hydrolase n=1 Tax=Thioalkalicoccus limnaeus TaxID=120681 RepID=A0ABV4BI69_9GAMM